MSELVSIIIPTRNRAPVLARCLEALACQQTNRYQCEITVVDDCSNDRTAEVVLGSASRCPFTVQLVRQAKPLGANAARNRGLEVSHGEIVVLLDDDVLVPPAWLEKLLGGIHHSGTPVASGAVRLTVNGQIAGKHREELGTYLGEILTAPSAGNGEIVPVLGNMAAFRWVFDRAKFDEALRPPIEEVDWLRRAGVTASFLPEAWVWHCKSDDELRLKRIVKGAWQRGSEGGWWMRERVKMPAPARWWLAFGSAKTCARAIGHALVRQCWGGVVVGAGELSKAMALVGLINWRDRRAESWR